ncbi:15233_t:CDS:1, partial [Gigaspora margarita]
MTLQTNVISQTDATLQREAKDLPCIFISLAIKYKNDKLLKCEITEKQ